MSLCFGYGENIAGLMTVTGIDLEQKILSVIQVGFEVSLENSLSLGSC